jgi:uncharacterized membrane protein
MPTLNECKRFFYVAGLIGLILCFAPNFVRVLDSQPEEQFSELYVLGEGQPPMAENYPFNVSAVGSYYVVLGIVNHMGVSMYYSVDVKFRNESESLPNGDVASPLSALYDYRVFLTNGQAREDTLAFSFQDVLTNGSISCSVGEMHLNDTLVQLNKTALWDNENKGFYYQLFIELWAYNDTQRGLIYNDRFVGRWLNMT